MAKKSFVKKKLHNELEIDEIEEFIKRNARPPERPVSREKQPLKSSSLNPQARVREILNRSVLWRSK